MYKLHLLSVLTMTASFMFILIGAFLVGEFQLMDSDVYLNYAHDSAIIFLATAFISYVLSHIDY